MADNFDARASLAISLDGLKEALNELERAKSGAGDLYKVEEALTKATKELSGAQTKLAGDFKETANAAKKAGGKLAPDANASKEWQDLAKKVRDAEQAYADLSKTAAAAGKSPLDMGTFMQGRVSKDDLAQYRQGSGANLLGDEGAQTRQAAKDQKNLDDIKRRTIAAQFDQERKNSEYLAKLKRQSLEDELKRVQRIAAERRKAAEAEKAAYDKGMAGTSDSQLGQRLANAPQGRTVAQRGLRDMGLADWDRQFASAEANIGAKAREDALNALPRLRYALYDVATSAGIASAAISGVGIASITAYASMESSFTGVERTLDNVSDPAKIQALRSELVGLTREIPQTFANISQIATLGNQLGIDARDIAKFTEVTAKFSAVTGMTAEASAQAFGSLGELLNVQSRDYEALGSSIALVGRRSVATEQEIVSMTTRLAASATKAGFTSQQVVALSGAFASLRIAPERAQGVMEIYFNRLNTAISQGGPRLEAFAKTAGITAAEVEALVRTDPTAFFEKFVTGLGQMDNIAQTGALEELGLQGIRAGEVFGRVSSNVEVFNKALTDANQGWAEGTELGAQYAKVVDDLASRWQIFLNSVQEAGAAVGAILAPALGLALDILTKMSQGFAAITENPVGAWFVGIAVAIGAIIAVITAFIAVTALSLASLAAMKTAIGQLGLTAGVGAFGLRGLSVAATQVGVSMGISTGAMHAFKVALASTGIGLVVVALGTLAAGFMSAAQGAGELSAELKPVADSLARAIEQDTEKFFKTGEAVTTITRNITELASETDIAGNAAAVYAGVQDATADSVDGATQKIREQTIALGEQAEAILRKQLADDDDFRKVANDPKLIAAAENAGFTVSEMINRALTEKDGASAYIQSIRDRIAALRDEMDSARASGDTGRQREILTEGYALHNYADALQGAASRLDAVRTGALETAKSYDAAGVSMGIAGDAATDSSADFDAAASSLQDIAQSALNTEGRMFSLGKSLAENAGAWDIYSEAGRSNLGALYALLDAIAAETPDNTRAIAANFQALYETLIKGGFATEQQLAMVQTRIQGLTGGAPVQAAQRNFASLFDGMHQGVEKVEKATREATKAVRTLVDYASDLSSVMKRAFDIRFGGRQGLDQIASGWNGIAEQNDASRKSIDDYRSSIQDTVDKVAELQQQLRSLSADRATKQYWLSIAELYGDQLRANQLREEIATIDGSSASTNKQITDEQRKASEAAANITAEQQKLSRGLVGNTSAAIANRAALLGLVGDYQGYLQALAASGASQATLKSESARLRAEFINQATSMGFSRDEVGKYATAFSDMSTILDKTPRNITVGFNPNPALQALAELEARSRTSGVTAGSNYRNGFQQGVGIIPPPPVRTDGLYDIGFIGGRRIRGGLIDGIGTVQIGEGGYKSSGGRDRYQSDSGLGWASGGYTGGTSSSEVRGAVHGKEFVFDATATRTIGVNNLNYMHNAAQNGRIAGLGGGSNGGTGDLSAASIDRLARAISYYSKDPGIQAQAIQRAALGANIASNAQGRS